MSQIKFWSTAAASNNASPPDGFPEGMAPSSLNDGMREVMSSVKKWYDDAQWVDPNATPTYVSASTFTLVGDKRTTFEIGRRIKASNGSSTLYGTIHSSTYTGAASTGVYCTLDTGSFTASLTAVAVSILTKSNPSMPDNTVSFANSASACTRAQFCESASVAHTITDGTNTIRTKVLNIGSWSMLSATSQTVTHGISSIIKVVGVDVTINNDAGVGLYPLLGIGAVGNTTPDGWWLATSTYFLLNRTNGGSFDSAAYGPSGGPGGNRGYIRVNYID